MFFFVARKWPFSVNYGRFGASRGSLLPLFRMDGKTLKIETKCNRLIRIACGEPSSVCWLWRDKIGMPLEEWNKKKQFKSEKMPLLYVDDGLLRLANWRWRRCWVGCGVCGGGCVMLAGTVKTEGEERKHKRRKTKTLWTCSGGWRARLREFSRFEKILLENCKCLGKYRIIK